MYTYTVDENLIVHLLKDGNEIDQVGPWDLADGAAAWGVSICAKYNENPDWAYPREKPVANDIS
jgi:hypothetical protein